MSKNEIRLRKQKLTEKGSERFRNFSNVKKRHERELRMKKIIRIFTIIAAALIVIILIIAMQMIIELREKEKDVKIPDKQERSKKTSVFNRPACAVEKIS